MIEIRDYRGLKVTSDRFDGQATVVGSYALGENAYLLLIRDHERAHAAMRGDGLFPVDLCLRADECTEYHDLPGPRDEDGNLIMSGELAEIGVAGEQE